MSGELNDNLKENLQGDEIARVLATACERTGLSPATTTRLMLEFAIVWGEALMAHVDKLVVRETFREMTERMNTDGPDT